MRHRSPRPLLDFLQSPTTVRRGALAATAVVAFGTTGFVLTSGDAVAPGPDSPVTQADGPTALVTPTSVTSDRDQRPSRSAARSATPDEPAPTERTRTPAPTPEPTDVPSVSVPTDPASAARTAARASSPRPSHSPSPSRSSSPSSSPSDTTPPETTAQTDGLVGAVWTLVFGADEPATFQCSLDGAAWSSCSATDAVTLVSPGPHSLAVRATDEAGNTDPTPATVSVTLTGADLP